MNKLIKIRDRFGFDCPGCKCMHWFNETWQFNGDFEKPTVSPSIKVSLNYRSDDTHDTCHMYIKDGMIQFLSDCTHSLAGKTVHMIDV